MSQLPIELGSSLFSFLSEVTCLLYSTQKKNEYGQKEVELFLGIDDLNSKVTKRNEKDLMKS